MGSESREAEGLRSLTVLAGVPHSHEPGFECVACKRNGAVSALSREAEGLDAAEAALRDFAALFPADRWHLLRSETQATLARTLRERE